MVIQEKKTAAKTNSDLWLYTLSGLNVLTFLITVLAVFVRTESSDVKVPIRLISSNEFVQGSWWNSYLMLAIIMGILVMTFVYSSRLKKLNPIYRNGVMVFGLCLQIFAAAILFRVSGLSSLI
jgi:hypothetical protein